MGKGGDRYLAIYLNDHLAGATLGTALAQRATERNRGTAFGPPLARLTSEVETDLATLKSIMARLEVAADRLKQAMAWTGEKAGRLKPNGRLVGYSPLSRLVELEALTLGATGKLAMWEAFSRTLAGDSRLAEFDFGALAKRARSQRIDFERLRLEAARESLGSA